MYLDAILDITSKPIFNDTPEKTRTMVEILSKDSQFNDCRVCIGRTLELVSLPEYLTLR